MWVIEQEYRYLFVRFVTIVFVFVFLTFHSLSSMASFSLTFSPSFLPKPKDPSSHAFPHTHHFVLRMPHQPQHLQTPLLLPKIQSSRHQITGICLVIYIRFYFFFLFFKFSVEIVARIMLVLWDAFNIHTF